MSPKREKSFKEAIGALEEIVTRLEKGEVPLEDSLKLYQEGKNLAKFLEEKLSVVEEKLKKLVKTEEGTVEAKPMTIEE
ncbi:exodeoxyribonuclease VII small subunit [candidate division TA06 bacterium]|nr:exodeoxyribonuclease VII small subunit [candidate division TA06 bacterium]